MFTLNDGRKVQLQDLRALEQRHDAVSDHMDCDSSEDDHTNSGGGVQVVQFRRHGQDDHANSDDDVQVVNTISHRWSSQGRDSESHGSHLRR